ncbi:MAG: hypothetical protein ACRDVW_03635 [Acidimicrobiales bacterium]
MTVLLPVAGDWGAGSVAAPHNKANVGEPLISETLFSFSGRAGGVALDVDGAAVVSDSASGTIWRIDGDGTARPMMGTAVRHELSAEPLGLSTPAGLALSPDGSMFVTDTSGHRVCALSLDGRFRVVAGSANGYRDGPAHEALFRFPSDVAFGPEGSCYVADTGNDRIRRISLDGIVSTLAGSIYDYGNGHGPHGRFRRPGALDVDADGVCYVADTGNNAIRQITPDGEVTTLAGAPGGGDRDGHRRGVGLRWPTGLAVGVDGSVWVVDHGNGRLRYITPDGTSTTHLQLSAPFWPTAVAMSADGAVIVAGTELDDGHVEKGWLKVFGTSR